MAIRKARLDDYPGAKSELLPTITGSDCALYPSMSKCMRALEAAGYAVTMRGGRGITDANRGNINQVCLVCPKAEISAVGPDGVGPPEEDWTRVEGSGVGGGLVEEAKVELWEVINELWFDATFFVLTWTETRVVVNVDPDLFPGFYDKVRVTNFCGNADTYVFP